MTYNRKDLGVQVNIKSNKGYTMREIGALEDRIKKLEYYTVLNALSLDTKTLSIRDSANQLERFKNGIFADPFNDHTLGRTEDSEYSIAVSSIQSILRPTFNQLFHDFQLVTGTSTNLKVNGKLAMIDYDSEFLGGNPFATIYRNCTESYYNFKGFMQLFPNYDANKSTTPAAPQNINIDIAGAFQELLALGIAQNIDTVVGDPVRVRRTRRTNFWEQTTTETITDIAVSIQPITTSLGPLVTDVSLLPYMAPRLISVIIRGLKPNTRIYPYFDEKPVSEFCGPAAISAAYIDINGNLDNTLLASLVAGKEYEVLTPTQSSAGGTQWYGSAIQTDSNGSAYLIFSLPADTFRTGDRVFTVTNTDDLAATAAIITSAEAIYTASSLSVTTSEKSFTVQKPIFTPTTASTSTTETWTTRRRRRWKFDPVAETFVIGEDLENFVPGVYLTQIGVFFKSKSTNLGITLNVCDTTVGLPDSDRILGVCHLEPSQVGTSNDSSTETVFTFQSPVLLQSDNTYAFYLEPDGSNPDYEIWISEVGGTDKLTGRAITQQPYSGVMCVSSNSKTWNVIQSQDIKFKLYRAKFKYNSAVAVFSNEHDDFLSVTNVFRTSSGTPVRVGDVVYSANSANLLQTFTNTSTHPFGIVQYFNELDGIMYIDQSNGKFSNSAALQNLKIYRVNNYANVAQIIANNVIANCTVVTVDNPIYHGAVPKFTVFEPIGTSVTYEYYGTSNGTSSFAKDTAPAILKNEALFEYNDYERVFRSYSNEVAAGSYGANGSATYVVTLNTNNKYVSPVIDLSTKTFNFIQNLINNDETNESTRYGSAKNKYISRTITLNQESEDLIVYLTGYRPQNTNIKVYGKFLNTATDNQLFDEKVWTELEFKNNMDVVYSNDIDDYKEYVYGIPASTSGVITASLTPFATYSDTGVSLSVDNIARGTASYNSPSPTGGTVYNINRGFNSFSIKILLLSEDPVKIPNVRDVRALALQM